MKKISTLFIAGFLLSSPVFPGDYNLGELAKAKNIEPFNRTLDPAKAGSLEVVFLNAAADDGLAWVSGIELSGGASNWNQREGPAGPEFVGIAFHGQDDKTFDAVYLRPFNFQATEEIRRSHSIQYISMPGHDWSDLRNNHPGKYESAIAPPPAPESWVKLKLVVKGKRVSAFVNGSDKPALVVELLSDHPKGKLGLWVGNGSDGWFQNLKVTPEKK